MYFIVGGFCLIWYNADYIPPNAKDTSKAIYGVIHRSQVGFECE
ncbi:hypothetical protein [Helicobacter sp. T3_23-1056]